MMSTYFKNDETNYLPILKAILKNPLGDKSTAIELVIDTGFQGGVLIPLKTYVELGLHLLEEQKVVARTAAGNKVELRASKVLIEFHDLHILCSAYTTLGVKRSLIGREVLKKTGLLYKPPNELRIGLSNRVSL